MISKIACKTTALAIATSFALTLAPAAAQPNIRTVRGIASWRSTNAIRKPDAYVYVSDANNEKVYVYPVGVPNPSPINEVDIAGIPTGMAVTNDGNLYVAIENKAFGDSIAIFSPAGAKLVGSIGSASGITSIRDLAFDAAGNLFVSCLRTLDGAAGVVKFAKNSTRAIAWYPSPTSQNYGVLVDAQDNVFLDLGMYGMAVKYTQANPNAFTTEGVMGAPTPGGLAFFGTDLIMSGGTGLWVFTPSPPGSKYPYTRTSLIDYGVGHGTGYISLGSDGTLYVPVYGLSGGHSKVHEVRIYRGNTQDGRQFTNYSTITTGLQYPAAVATGPK